MKKIISIFVIALFVCAVAAPVFADAGTKFTDGIKRAVTSPTNIVDDIQAEYEAAEFKPFGVFGGMIKGIGNTAVDIVGGLFSAATFFIDNE